MPDEQPMPAEKPMRADARRNRDAIIAAARTAFERDEQLRFDDFAGRAGVGVGTLYRHFPTRAALSAAVYRGEVDVLCRRARDSTLPPGESLDDFLRGFVEYVVDHAGLARTLAAVVDATTQAEGGGELERTLAELLARAAADGAIRSDVTSGTVLMLLHGIGAGIDRPGWAMEARAAADLVSRGLRAR
ncbi:MULTISPECIES: TetR/AcrR family transcriptional regulator [Curtobacterium]|uniref:TetR/AcrR family transcriptional regulator n=1 Tax=Curtobacterium TaxID=2034 RepID=UPI0021C5CB3A|nr:MULTISPECIES: TetR/AcrR family transcriptional regulator [Curtobacterium]UXN16675.1 TetR/AcrR family transcriptional regulator [Curtobacterium flaccumfaciens pv. poinsettiae]